MTDDPREVLRAAGVECAEVEDYEFSVKDMNEYSRYREITGLADAAIVAVAKLAAKYKWQREIQVVGALDYNGAIARLDELWESHLREQHDA